MIWWYQFDDNSNDDDDDEYDDAHDNANIDDNKRTGIIEIISWYFNYWSWFRW